MRKKLSLLLTITVINQLLRYSIVNFEKSFEGFRFVIFPNRRLELEFINWREEFADQLKRENLMKFLWKLLHQLSRAFSHFPLGCLDRKAQVSGPTKCKWLTPCPTCWSIRLNSLEFHFSRRASLSILTERLNSKKTIWWLTSFAHSLIKSLEISSIWGMYGLILEGTIMIGFTEKFS